MSIKKAASGLMSEKDDVSIVLGPDDALVLYDLLGRWIDKEDGALIRPQTRDEAELWALNALRAALAKVLVAPFDDHYASLVQQARRSVRDRCGDWPTASGSDDAAAGEP